LVRKIFPLEQLVAVLNNVLHSIQLSIEDIGLMRAASADQVIGLPDSICFQR